MSADQQQSMEIEAAVLEAIDYPDTVFVLPLKKKVPTSKLDNVDIVPVEGTNRRRLVGTYTEEVDGETKVHKVSVYIKSAKPEGEEGEKKPRSRKPKADGVDPAIKKSGSKRSKRLSEKETEVIGEILVALGKLQKLHKSSRKQAAAAAEAAQAQA